MNNTICLELKGLSCANCANKIENSISKLSIVEAASVSVINREAKIKLKHYESPEQKEKLLNDICSIVKKIEPEVKVIDKNQIEKSDEKDKSAVIKIVRISLAITIFVIALVTNKNFNYSLYLFLASYILLGFDVIKTAVKNLFIGEFFDENFLMFIATVGAFFIGEYSEAVGVMLFYQIGEFFQDYAVDKSRTSIKSLINIRPEYANLFKDNKITTVKPEEVKAGDIIAVKPGERIPLDGIIKEGSSQIDTAALTGEALPIEVYVGSKVLSGSINLSGLLVLEVTKTYENSTVAKILEITQNAAANKSPAEKFITKFTKIYTPVVVFSAIALVIFGTLLTKDHNFYMWLERALSFLVISCPCALVISVPLGFFSGIGVASKNGILVKGGNYLQALSEADTIVFDKTGTLTKGVFEVTNIAPYGSTDNKELVYCAFVAEKMSNHPIAKSIQKAIRNKFLDIANEIELLENNIAIESYEEIAGQGIKVKIKNDEILAGNNKLMEANQIVFTESVETGSVVYVAKNNIYLGYILISDEIKDDAISAIKSLKSSGIEKTAMLTGDKKDYALMISKQLGIDTTYYELLPNQKVSYLEKIMNSKSNKKRKTIYVGDGINDTPVLARADAGIAMGAMGADSAIEAADIVIMNDEVSKINTAVKIAKNTIVIVKQNIALSLILKFVIIILAAFGLANMWLAVFADVGVALLAVLNSVRLLVKRNM